MKILQDIEGLKQAILFGESNPHHIIALSQYVANLWEGRKVAEWVTENQEVSQHAIDKGLLHFNDSVPVFKSMILFDYLYAIHFSRSLLAGDNKEWKIYYDLIWQKQYKEKSIEGYKLGKNFDLLVLLAMEKVHGVDLLVEWSQDIKSRYSNRGIALESLFPFINPVTDKLLNFCSSVESQAPDLLATVVARGVYSLAKFRVERGGELLKAFDHSTNETLWRMQIPVVIGLVEAEGMLRHTEQLLKWLKSSANQAELALTILSRIKVTQSEWAICGSEIMDAIAPFRYREEAQTGLILLDVYRNLHPFTDAIGEYALTASQKNELGWKSAVLGLLWYTGDQFCSEIWYEKALLNITVLSDNNMIQNANWTLNHLIEKNGSLVSKYLNTWIDNEANEPKQIEIFGEVIAEFYRKYPAEGEEWITRGFLSHKKRFHVAFGIVINELWSSSIKHPVLSKQVLDKLVLEDIIHLIFKISGYVYSKEPLESLTFSILRREPEDATVTKWVKEAFLQHITLNYGGSNQFLREQLSTVTPLQQNAIQEVLDYNENYNKEVQKIRKIPELKLYNNGGINFIAEKMKRVSAKMNETVNQKREPSFMDMIKKISLKGGRGFFSKYDYRYTPPIEMGHYSSSFEMPMGDAIDTVHQRLNQLYWRKEINE